MHVWNKLEVSVHTHPQAIASWVGGWACGGTFGTSVLVFCNMISIVSWIWVWTGNCSVTPTIIDTTSNFNTDNQWQSIGFLGLTDPYFWHILTDKSVPPRSFDNHYSSRCFFPHHGWLIGTTHSWPFMATGHLLYRLFRFGIQNCCAIWICDDHGIFEWCPTDSYTNGL